MLNKNNFLKNFSSNSNKFNKNLNKTKKIFKIFKSDLRNSKIPLLHSYEKNYQFDFSKEKIKNFSKYKNIVIIGMGGSILGTKSIYYFCKKKIKKNAFFFDNLDPDLYLKFSKIKDIKNSCFIIVSKSGNTLETVTNFGIIYSKFLFKKKIIFITEIKDSALVALASKLNADIIEHKNFISGRYSLLSEVGMFPAKLMGLNIDKFKNLKKLINNKNFTSILIKNVATIYTLNTTGIRSSVLLNYNSNLNDFNSWYQQLIGESLGKKGKGITPILSFGPKDHHSLLQLYLDGPKDKFFTFFNFSRKEKKIKIFKNIIPSNMQFLENKNIDFIIQTQSNAVKKIFKLKKIPFREILFKKGNEEEFGEIATFLVLETILLSRLMKLNPFDQPAVEVVKKETKKLLR